MKALIIIDYVNDFVAENGALTCGKPAQVLDDYISELVEDFSKNGNFVAIASDRHPENDVHSPEHGLFPPHCIEGTAGSDLYGKTLERVAKVPAGQLISVDKCRYSAFAGTNLDIKFRERGVTDLYLTGVCTDICVLHTAIDAYNLGYKIFVCEKGVASFNAGAHQFALEHMKNALGASIV
ncbi:MAG: cysteine hydrolase [Methanosarcinales archaeon]|jgi:nicotinamidase-related amidase|nr:cysteine hydrolase [Methanosarcinales archaeon]